MHQDIAGKVVPITGGGTGPGAATAYAIEQPLDVDVNEIVLRPTAEDF